MAGVLVPFLPMTTFDFSFLTTGSKTIVVHPALNVTGYYYARLIVRVHQIDIAAGTSRNIAVSGYGILPSKEDSQEFVLNTSTLEVTLNSSTTVGLSSDTDSDMFPFLKMCVTGNYNGSTARMFAVLSADLLLREA